MLVSSVLNGASRGYALKCSPTTLRNIHQTASRTATRSCYTTPPRASYHSTRVPLTLSKTSSNSTLPHQQHIRPKQQRTLLRPQVRHCSHRRSMCRHNHEASGSSFDITQGREILPANVKPIHYHLTLEPNLETFEYKGTVVIE